VHRAASLAAALIVAGCAQPFYYQERESSAVMPRALGIGASTPSCILFCWASAAFEQDGTHSYDAQESEVSSKTTTKGLGK
jgi:hypothetical protein